MKSKSEFLRYKNAAVLRRYMKDYGASKKEANLIWLELMKYLYLASYCNNHKIMVGLPFFDQVNNKIDQMWHSFLLFTKDYREFCNCYCGIFLDHAPSDHTDKSKSLKNPDHYNKTKENLKNYLGLVYKIWGKETLEKWFVHKIYK
jgi:hypothetical protein